MYYVFGKYGHIIVCATKYHGDVIVWGYSISRINKVYYSGSMRFPKYKGRREADAREIRHLELCRALDMYVELNS